jgi:hypothetical protein
MVPLQPISFADFFLADVACSMAKSFSDVERAVCSMLMGRAEVKDYQYTREVLEGCEERCDMKDQSKSHHHTMITGFS